MASLGTSSAVGRVLADRYRVVAPIGSGASARVYLAEDLQLSRRVAVKILHEGLASDRVFLKRFEAEARAAAALNHPNVMHVYDSGSDDGQPFLVCEYLGGGSLRAILDAGALLTPSQALVVGLEAARGLAYAHREGVVHRDIKPANLLFGEDGRLRIGDFGLARALAEAAWTEPEGVLLGTARYAAPEQAQGHSVDGRADIYSLGLVLVEAVTGVVPFAEDTTVATLMARCEHDLVVPEALGRLRSVVERCGRLDPELRPDAGELEIAFMAAAEDLDRPEPLPLAGALVVTEPGTDGDRADHADGRPADLTVVDQPVVVAGGGDGATNGATNGAGVAASGFDIALSGDEPLAAAPTDHPGATAGLPGTGLDPTDPVPLIPLVVRAGTAEAGGTGAAAAAPASPPTGIPADDQPRRRRRWPVILAVLVILAGAAGGGVAWWKLRTPSYPVPNLVGMSIKAATGAVARYHWTIDSSQLVRKDGTRPDDVVDQDPVPGTSLAKGRRLKLVLSLGNTLVPLPAVTNQQEAAATAALQAAGLNVTVAARPNDEVAAAGTVMKVDAPAVDASGQLPKGSAVQLTVSAGPAPRTIPVGLGGKPVDVVTQALKNLQLVVAVDNQWSDFVAGTVLSLSPADNAVVPRGSTVNLVVSKGPQPVPIPDVTGKTGIDATTILQAAGFPVTQVDGSPTNTVLATDPPAGELHQKGTGVRVITRK